MSKQLAVSAALSVLMMATFAVLSDSNGAVPRIWSETGAAIKIATPVASTEAPALLALDLVR